MPPYGDFHRFEHLFLRRLFFLSVLYHFLRVVADLRIMPNTSGHKRIQEYAVSVNDLEDIIGIDIFTNIDDRFEEMVESDVYFKHWGL